MPQVTIRRAITVDKIPDSTITGSKVVAGAIGSTALKSRAVGSPALGSAVIARCIQAGIVSSSKVAQLLQSGSVKIRAYAAPGSFTAFSTAYGTRPIVALNPKSTTQIVYAYPYAVGPGSFGLIGSPIEQYCSWLSFGFKP